MSHEFSMTMMMVLLISRNNNKDNRDSDFIPTTFRSNRECALFQGNVIQNNAKNGVIVQQYDLALREVNRSQAGNYTCVASNVEGDGYSNIVELKIMCEYACAIIDIYIYIYIEHKISVV